MKIIKTKENDKTILELTENEFLLIQRLLEKDKQKVNHKIKDSLSKKLFNQMLEFNL